VDTAHSQELGSKRLRENVFG